MTKRQFSLIQKVIVTNRIPDYLVFSYCGSQIDIGKHHFSQRRIPYGGGGGGGIGVVVVMVVVVVVMVMVRAGVVVVVLVW